MRCLVVAFVALSAIPSEAVAVKAKLTPEQRVNRIMRKVGPMYGNGPTPVFRFGKVPSPGQAAAITVVSSDGSPPTIHLGRGASKMLTSRDPFKRRAARQTVLWELGRTVQGERGNGWLTHKTNKVSRRLNKQQAKRQALAARTGKRKG